MNKSLKIAIRIAALAISLGVSPALFAANAVIDVLVVYTQGVADAYGGDPGTRINQLFQVSNQIYRDSGVNFQLRVANTLQVNYTDENSADTALHDITYAKNPAFAGVAAAREKAKADMVILYRPFKAVHGGCGLAWIGGKGTNGDFSDPSFKKFMFAHIAINSCGDFVTAHELGHNMGLKHSRKQDGSGGTFAYALGYGEVNQFATIMAYQSDFNVDYWSGKLYKFSNPDLTCKGRPCGISRDDPVLGADARYTLNIVGPQIADFYLAADASSASSVGRSRAAATSAARSIAAPVSSFSSSSVRRNLAPSAAAVQLTFASRGQASSVSASINHSVSSAASSLARPTVAFNQILDVTRYSSVDWSNEVRRDKALSLEQAKAIAAKNLKITYFFRVTSAQISLGSKGVFYAGDTIFFSGKPKAARPQYLEYAFAQ